MKYYSFTFYLLFIFCSFTSIIQAQNSPIWVTKEADNIYYQEGDVSTADAYFANGVVVSKGLREGLFTVLLEFELPGGSTIDQVNIGFAGYDQSTFGGLRHLIKDINTGQLVKYNLRSGDDRKLNEWHYIERADINNFVKEVSADTYQIEYGVYTPGSGETEAYAVNANIFYTNPEPADLYITGFETNWNVGSGGGTNSGKVCNSGDLELQWNIQGGTQYWYGVSPSSGSITSGQCKDVTITVEENSSTTSTRYDQVIFANNSDYNDNGAVTINQARALIPAELNVTNHPGGSDNTWEVSPIGEAQTISFENAGEELLYWDVYESRSWIQITQGGDSGEIEGGGDHYIQVTIDRYEGTETRSGYLDLNDPSGRVFRLYIEQEPVITPADLVLTTLGDQTYSSAGDQFTIQVNNEGGETLNWNSEHNMDWVTVSPSSGNVNPGGNESVNITIAANSNPEERSGSIRFFNEEDTNNDGSVNVTQEPVDGVQKWGEITFEEMIYNIYLETNSDINLENKLLHEGPYESVIDKITVFKETESDEVLISDTSIIQQIISVFSSQLISEKMNWEFIGDYSRGLLDNIQYNNTLIDEDFNQYPINSLYNLSDNDIHKLECRSFAPSIVCLNGTKSYEYRYEAYKSLLRGIVYYYDETQIGEALNNAGPIVNEIINLSIDSNDLVADFLKINKEKFSTPQGLIKITNSKNVSIDVDKYENISEKIGIVKNIFDSFTALNEIRKREMLVYTFLTEDTGQKIEILYESIINSPTNLYDKALINAVKDVRYDFWDKYNKPEQGDWKIILDEMVNWEVAGEFGVDLAKIWATTAISQVFSYYGVSITGPLYLVVIPIKSSLNLLESYDIINSSNTSVTIHEIIRNSLSNNVLKRKDSYSTTLARLQAYQLQAISGYMANNYLKEYLKNFNVTVSSLLHFNNDDRQTAIKNFTEEADKSQALKNTIIPEWWISGKQIGDKNNVDDHSWLMTKVSTDEQQTDYISKPLPASIESFNAVISVNAGGAISNKNHPIEYRYDWGNGIYSDWSGSHKIYIYSSTGNYSIKVQARSQINTEIVSEWSETNEHTVYSTDPAPVPSEPNGNSTGLVDEELTYITPNTNSTIYEYRFDWGDGKISSWGEGTAGHTYLIPNDYAISVQARLKGNPYSNSGWSGEKWVSISEGEFKPFITTWKTDNEGVSSSNQIKIFAEGTNYLIEWEEVGNSSNNGSEIATDDHTITFPSAGTYQVSISGDFHRFYFPGTEQDNSKLLSVEQWGDVQWSTMRKAFYGAINLHVNTNDVPDLSTVNNMEWMFYNAKNFNHDIGDWNVSNVEKMGALFQNASNFNQDIGSWDVGNVTDMFQMFTNASSFNQDLGEWNVGKVTDMYNMFSGATSFNQDISNWNMKNVKFTPQMFIGATSFNQDISGWNFENLENADAMFWGASEFNQDLSSWNISSIESMEDFFYESGLSTNNYDATLKGWANQQNIPFGIALGAKDLTYCDEESRNTLINTYNWTITGDNLAENCTSNTRINFFATLEKYTEYNDINQICKDSFGSDARLADWTDIESYYTEVGSLDEFFIEVERNGEHGLNMMVSRNGNRFYNSGDRQYFISRHDYNLPSYYLAHDNIENYLLSLGSWYDLNNRILCYSETYVEEGVTVHLQEDWNMIGHPVDDGPLSYSNIFNYATQEPYKFVNNGYSLSSNIEPGIGYWIHISQNETIKYSDPLIETVNLNLENGWNLISGIGTPLPVSSISDPQNILISDWFGFDGSYYTASSLDPGRGYWIKANQAGSITLQKQASKQPSSPLIASYQPEEVFNSLHFVTEENDTLQTLYFGDELPNKIEIDRFVMPPTPPKGSFDARFSGIGTRLSESDSPGISLQLPENKVIYVGLDASGYSDQWKLVQLIDEVSYQEDDLTGEASVQLYSDQVNELRLEYVESFEQDQMERPVSYTLEQNYPNPFNPTTQITYQIPQQEFVQLEVFDMLGRRVSQLVNETKSAGSYSVTFDASGLNSGVYIYRLTAGSYSQVRRLLLVK